MLLRLQNADEFIDISSKQPNTQRVKGDTLHLYWFVFVRPFFVVNQWKVDATRTGILMLNKDGLGIQSIYVC